MSDYMPRKDVTLPPRMPEAAEITALRARLAEVEARAYKLAVAIMGGEDAVGYADSIDADVLADQIRKERMQHSEWTDACVKAALATARRDALEEAANLSGWWLVMNAHGEPDGTYCSVQPSDEPSAAKYVSAAAIRALIAQEDALPERQ